MFAADQTPMEFAMPGKFSLNIRGTSTWMWVPKSGSDKRFVSIMVCIRAQGEQIIKPIIIFRGEGLDISLLEQQLLSHVSNVRFYFQKNAWADGDFCEYFLKSMIEDIQNSNIDTSKEIILGLDGLEAQHNQRFLQIMQDLYIATGIKLRPVYTPPNCTDCIAPCDHHVLLRLKNTVKDFYRAMSQAKRAEWALCDQNRSLEASSMRVTIARWIGDAWATLSAGSDSESFFKSAFTSTGFLMEVNDPSKHIRIKGLDNYQVYL